MRKRLAPSRGRIVFATAAAFLAVLLSLAAFGASEVRSGDRLAFALTGARVIAAPGRAFDRGVVVVRGGVIEAVGSEGSVSIPADARVYDVRGKVVHAAFIDPHVAADRLAGRKPRGPSDEEEPSEERTPPASRRPSGPASHPLASVRAEERVIDSLSVADRVADSYRRLGFAVVAAAPPSGILRGRGSIVSLADGPISGRIVVSEGAQVISLDPEPVDFGSAARVGYPVSKMGAVALVRQSFLDARWWGEAEAAYAKRSAGQPRPRFVAANAALLPAAQGREAVVFEASDVLSLLRGLEIAREMKLRAISVGAGDEYRLRDRVAAAKPDLVLRVNFPRPYKLDDETEWLDVPLERLRAIDRAPSNPKWLRDAGVRFSFTTAGLDDPADFPGRVKEAIARGLSRDDALAAVTTVPARQLGLGNRLGELSAGRIANIVVETGEPFTPGSRVSEIWIDGRRYETRETENGKRETKSPETEPVAERPGAPRSRRRAGRGSKVGRRAGRDGLDAGRLGNPGERRPRRLGRQGRGRGPGADRPRGRRGNRRKGKARHPRDHRRALAHRDRRPGQRVRERGHRGGPDPGRPRSVRRRHLPGTRRGNDRGERPPRLGELDRRTERDREVAPRRRAGRPADRDRAGRNQVRARREPQAVELPADSAAVPADPHGGRGADPGAFSRGARLSEAPGGVPEGGGGEGRLDGIVPPHPDLQLEAIAEILEGKRKIHCHSYVKSEILEMIRTAEEFGVQVATFQHNLEGYKIADEIAKHGAGSSIFSDWWAYKFEVYDAIPYAGPLLHERGVLVSYNSDSDELARRLNTEAAKAVKYGGLAPADALRVRDVESREAARHLRPDRIARARQGWGLRRVERRPALELHRRARDLDRGEEVLRPRGGPRARGRRSTGSARSSSRKRRRSWSAAGSRRETSPRAAPPPAATRAPEEPELKPTPPTGTPAPTPTPAPRRQP